MKTEVIASIFAHATSQKNCSTALPGSPICSIFHGIKRLCFERQNTLTINHAEFEPSQGGRHIIGELVTAHVHYAWMLINWNGPEGCGRRTRNRSTTWSGLIKRFTHTDILCAAITATQQQRASRGNTVRTPIFNHRMHSFTTNHGQTQNEVGGS